MSWSCSDSGLSSCQQRSCIPGLASVWPVPSSCGQLPHHPMLQGWLDAAEATLTASLTTQTHEDASHTMLTPQARQEQENLLGEVIAFRAFLRSL